MKLRWSPWGSRLPSASFVAVATLALAASTILLVDYLRPAPVFCAAGGGCDAIKLTRFAWIFGVIPTPLLGMISFAVALALLYWPGSRGRLAQLVWAAGSAVVAAGLLAVQAGLGKFCVYCTIVDVSALAVAALALHRWRAGWDVPLRRESALLALGVPALLAILAVAAPVVVAARVPPPPPPPPVELPDVIKEELARTPPGRVLVVDFADFECPWCRKSHAALAPVLHANEGAVRVVRVHVPLERIHPHATLAARAACCGEEQGRGDAMADALFETPAEELDEARCARLARELGLDVARYEECVGAARTQARLDADRVTFRAAKGHGLPLLYVGDQRLEGAQPKESIERAFTRARSRS